LWQHCCYQHCCWYSLIGLDLMYDFAHKIKMILFLGFGCFCPLRVYPSKLFLCHKKYIFLYFMWGDRTNPWNILVTSLNQRMMSE
jgi:hypothetical protein